MVGRPKKTRGKILAAMQKRSITQDIYLALHDLLERLELDSSPVSSDPRSVPYSAMGQLLANWHFDSRFLTTDGNPLPLRLSGKRSFSKLSEISAPNIRPDIMLSALKKAGAIGIDRMENVYVKARALYVYKDKELAAQYTASSLLSYIKTLRHNLNKNASMKQQLFHRMAVHERFDHRLLPALNLQMRRQGNGFLENFDNWMMRKNPHVGSLRKGNKPKHIKVVIGVYLAAERTSIDKA